MSKLYDKYFGEKEFYDSVADLMYDIMAGRIAHEHVVALANELYDKKLISSKSVFSKEQPSKWNENHVNYLMNGAGAGKLSKDYLIYYSKVATTVKNKKKNLVFISAVGGTIVVAGLVIFLILIK